MIQSTCKKSRRFLAFSFMIQAALILFCFSAFAAEVESVGEVRGVMENTEVGAVPSQSGPRETPTPAVAPNEHKAANILVHEDISYVVKEKSRNPGSNLVLDCTVSKVTNDAVLSRLAEKVYKKYDGKKYDTVTIFWHVGMNPQPATAWGRTDISKVDVQYAIVKY